MSSPSQPFDGGTRPAVPPVTATFEASIDAGSMDRLVASLLAAGFFLSVFFPYLQVIPLPTDTQPYAVLLAIVIYFAARDRGMPSEIVLLLFVFIFSLPLVALGHFDMGAIRSIAGYASLFFIPAATYIVLKYRGGLPERVVAWTVYVWFAVGSVQTFIWADFLTGLSGRGEGLDGFGGRGVVGLSPEPTHYAVFSIFLLVLVYLHKRGFRPRRRRLLYGMLVVQVVVFARSSMGILFLILLLGCFAIVNLLSVRKLAYLIIGLAAVAAGATALVQSGTVSIAHTRAAHLAQILAENPKLLLLTDGSINDRFFQIYFSCLGFFENWLLPHGYASWPGFVTDAMHRYSGYAWAVSKLRIMSGYGAAAFELGFIGLAVPISLTLALRRFFGADRRSFWFMALFLNTIMLAAIPLAFPLVGFLIGYLTYYARRDPQLRPVVGNAGQS